MLAVSYFACIANFFSHWEVIYERTINMLNLWINRSDLSQNLDYILYPKALS